MDIQGLRALAVSLVVIFHIWPNSLTGGFVGVDVFFVISGYLITSHLLKSPPATRSDLALFWARRVRRLLPAALLVLATTLLVSRIVAPATQWKDTALGSLAAVFYVENWRLASQAVDYLAAENAASPVQHFWSLSVEEQFYLFWPLLILLSGLLATRSKISLRTTAGVSILLIVTGSFAYSVLATASDPASAYFVTPTRVWELGIGAAVAVLTATRSTTGAGPNRAGPGLSAALAWGGIGAVIWSAVVYSGSTPFPGYAAAVPVLGTALVIWVAADGRWAPTRFFSWRQIQHLGDISYSVYLWHWPIIVLLAHVSGDRGFLDAVSIITATLILAALTKTHVEDRFRRQPPGARLARPLVLAAAGTAVLATAAIAQTAEVEIRQSTAREEVRAALAGEDPCFGAGAIDPATNCNPKNNRRILPDPAQAPEDKADAYADDCWVYRPFDEVKTCQYGSSYPAAKVAVIGNSHAGHWMPAIQNIARHENWQVSTYLASQCFPTAIQLDLETESFSENCLEWGRRVQEATQGDQFDLVVVSVRTGLTPAGSDDTTAVERAWYEGYRDYVRTWVDHGTEVLVIRDTPFPANTVPNIPDCVAANSQDLDACSGDRDAWMNSDPLADVIENEDWSGTGSIDLTDFFCGERCSPVIGGALVYFDSSHITATYAKTLVPYLRPSLVEAVGKGPASGSPTK